MNAFQPAHRRSTESAELALRELRVSAASRAARRQLGPLPWAALEELALAAQPHEDSWVASVGVRAIGIALGVTKNTAARAVAALRSAGIVTQVRVRTANGRSISAYRLQLPDGIAVQSRPALQDAHGDGINDASPKKDPGAPGKRRRSQLKRSDSPIQASLFDNAVPQAG